VGGLILLEAKYFIRSVQITNKNSPLLAYKENYFVEGSSSDAREIKSVCCLGSITIFSRRVMLHVKIKTVTWIIPMVTKNSNLSLGDL